MNIKRWNAVRYGSRRGLVFTQWHRILYKLGRYSDYYKIDWQSVDRLVFVCKGNICRSAYAEAVARSLGIDAISCGLNTVEDAPANSDAIIAAKKSGFDINGHKTKPVMYLILKKTDLLVTMEPWQAEFLNNNLTRQHNCTLLGLWSKPVLPHIQDPYGTSEIYFDKCFCTIKESVNELAKKIKQ